MASPGKTRSETRETSWFLVKLLIFVLVLRSFVFAPFSIPSESMLPRLLIGDYLIVAKWPYGFSRYALPFGPDFWDGRIFGQMPERGDVVVFKAPPGNSTDYIKRVIGLPGDLIQMTGGQLFINGAVIAKKRTADFLEPLTGNSLCAKAEVSRFRERNSAGGTQCRYPRFIETLPEGRAYQVLDLEAGPQDETLIYAVPAGHVFVMGDNRDKSGDSRFPAVEGGGVGMVPLENLVGRAWFGIYSTDGSAAWFEPWTWFSAARWERTGDGF